MTNRRVADWRSVLLVIGTGGGALLALLLSGGLFVYSILGFAGRGPIGHSATPLQVVVLASAAATIGALAALAAYYGLEHLRGLDVPVSAPQSLRIWQGIALVGSWATCAWVAQVLADAGPLQPGAALFYLVAICAPVYLLVRLTTGGLRSGSRRRFWGVFATGMLLSANVAVAAEVAAVFLGAVLLTAYVIFHPAQLIILQQLTSRLAAAPGIEEALTVLRPWLANPVALVIALFFFSGITPVIEEAAKSLAVWVIFDRLEAPLQGFVAGAVAGAGFGLVESLLASATPDSSWAYTLLARGGSTMMHIAAAAFAGWGVASLRASGRPGLLIGGYAVALLIHGAWNASVIALAFGGLRLASNGGGADPLGSAFVVVGVAVLAALCVTIPTGLGVINWRLRSGAVSGLNPQSDHGRTVAGDTGIAAGEGIDQDAD